MTKNLLHPALPPVGDTGQSRGAEPDGRELARLCLHQAPRLQRYFWFHTGSQPAAQSLVEETFFNAWCSWPHRDPLQPPPIWLYGVARRVLALRRPVPPAPSSEEPSGSDLVGSDTGIEAPIAAWRAVAALSRSEREILALRAGARLSEQEIAQITGHQPGHVEVVWQRVLARLRAHPAS